MPCACRVETPFYAQNQAIPWENWNIVVVCLLSLDFSFRLFVCAFSQCLWGAQYTDFFPSIDIWPIFTSDFFRSQFRITISPIVVNSHWNSTIFAKWWILLQPCTTFYAWNPRIFSMALTNFYYESDLYTKVFAADFFKVHFQTRVVDCQ